MGSDPRLYLYVQVLLSYVQIYLYVSTLIYMVPLCSRHNLIDLRFHYPGPLLPSSLASQTTWFGTLDV